MAARALMEVRKLEGEAAVRQPIVPLVDTAHPVYGRVKFDDADLAGMVEKFEALPVADGDVRELPITLQHDPAQGAVGWIRKVEHTPGQPLIGELHFNDKGRQAIAEREFPYLSPEVGADSGLKGLSLVVQPFFKGLLPSAKLFSEPADGEAEALGLMLFGDPEDLGLTGSDAQPTPRLRTEPEGEPEDAEHAAADDPGSPAGAQEPTQEFAAQTALLNLEAEVAELRRDKLTRQFADELGSLTFGDTQRIAPAVRDELATELARLPAESGQKLAALISTLRFYEPREIGLNGLATPGPRLTEEDRIVAAQLGLPEEG